MIIDEYFTTNVTRTHITKYKKILKEDLKLNDIVKLPIKFLTKGSHIKINVLCDNDNCGENKIIPYKDYYKHTKGLQEEYYCIKCSNIKKIKTCQNKYGVDNILSLSHTREQIKQTNIEKYGYEHHSKNEKIKEKKKKTCQERYDVETNLNLKSVKEKIKINSLKNYNTEHHLSSKEIRNKINKTRNQKILKKAQSIVPNDYLINNYYNNKFNVYHKKCNNNIEILNNLFYDRNRLKCEICTICNPIDGFSSDKEKQLKEYIKSLNIDYIENDRTILNGKELDIYIPSKNLAIEFNGLYWHSELYKDKNYHKEKTELCKEKEINLLHIFEDDWIFKQDIIKSIIKNKLGIIENKIFARNCLIKEVDSKNSRIFLDNNHIQGFSNSSYKLGLYYENELVSLMTFGYRHTNSKKEFELIRFCNKINYTIVGAASKLFKYFIKNYHIEESYLISYADISLFDGSLYDTLGFSFKHRTKPNYFWIVGSKREHRFKYNKQKLIKNGANPNLTEREIMYEKGHYRIFSSGQDRYEYHFN